MRLVLNMFRWEKCIYVILISSLFYSESAFAWGFYAHGVINRHSIYLLPPEMVRFYRNHTAYLVEHSTDPDKRRYMLKEEGPRHYIDLDHYGSFPFLSLPRKYEEAEAKFGADSLQSHGVVPWHVNIMLFRLRKAFKEKKWESILRLSAELGHYVSDAHVPLHTSSNHNGQKSGQKGIHGFWESRVPELLCESEFDFIIGKACYLQNPETFIWERILESALAVDSVLTFERELTKTYPEHLKYGFENRKGKVVKQYSSGFTIAYNNMLDQMIEKRMRTAVYSVACFWYTAWVDAGQPELEENPSIDNIDSLKKSWEILNKIWMKGGEMIGRPEDD
ncbi:MAG: hypothetical protein RIR96_1306 [Bacteroidota bacterium]